MGPESMETFLRKNFATEFNGSKLFSANGRACDYLCGSYVFAVERGGPGDRGRCNNGCGIGGYRAESWRRRIWPGLATKELVDPRIAFRRVYRAQIKKIIIVKLASFLVDRPEIKKIKMVKIMGKIMDWLNGKKTYIAALAAFIVVAMQMVVRWGNNEPLDLNLMFEALIALAMIFLRKGVKKNGTVI